MHGRRLLGLLLLVAFFVGLLAPRTFAQVPYVQYKQTFTAVTVGGWHPINGQGSCTAATSGTYTGLTAEIDGSADYNFLGASATSGGAIITGISSNGTTSGNLASAGFAGVRINVTALASGSVTIIVTCGNISVATFNGGAAANVVVTNTPGVTVQNTPAVVIASSVPLSVSISSPNPLNVNQLNTPTPIAVPSAPVTPPATVPAVYSITGCMDEPTPTPGPGTTVADQCNQYGHKIVGIEPNTSISLGGLSSPAPTPSPTAIPNMLAVQEIPHAYVGSGLIEALTACIGPNAGVATASPTSATDTQLVGGVSAKSVYICGIKATGAGTNTGYLEYSTSTTCASGFTALEDTFDFVANNGYIDQQTYAYSSTPPGDAACYHTTSTGQVRVTLWYTQY